ncbi:SDR family NAD(P)-dependent oxidoreductase [Rhizobium sp. WSM1325]|nr:SDR family NAD(P)-dependent oxidoreductase [Rhizobium leguminosarum]RWY66959.1 SDR family NAD(P)-dependent oxidoreductase [Rhizobium leguminosarum]
MEAAGPPAMVQSRDVRDEAIVMMFMGSFQETLGLTDILVNCAGIGCSKPFVETRFEDFDNVVKTDLYETFFFCREFVRRGQGKLGGKIINITSVHQAIPSRGNPSLRTDDPQARAKEMPRIPWRDLPFTLLLTICHLAKLHYRQQA